MSAAIITAPRTVLLFAWLLLAKAATAAAAVPPLFHETQQLTPPTLIEQPYVDEEADRIAARFNYEYSISGYCPENNGGDGSGDGDNSDNEAIPEKSVLPQSRVVKRHVIENSPATQITFARLYNNNRYENAYYVLDKRGNISTSQYEEFEYEFPASRPVITYNVNCQDTLPELPCNMFRELVRYSFGYATAWLNVNAKRVNSDSSFEPIRLIDTSDGVAMDRDPYHFIVRMADLDPKTSLGRAGPRSLRMSYNAKWYWDDLESLHQSLTQHAGSTFNRMLRHHRQKLISGSTARCSQSFMNVLLHEAFHTLVVGHSNEQRSLMYFQSRARMYGVNGNREMGGFEMLPNDVYMLRARWLRGNEQTVEELMQADNGGFYREFERVMRDSEEFLKYEELKKDGDETVTPAPATTTTAAPASRHRPRPRPRPRPPPMETPPSPSPNTYLFARTFQRLDDMLEYMKKYS